MVLTRLYAVANMRSANEEKQTMARELSNHAHAAKLIRQELKKRYPSTKFSVRSEIYSGGSSINVEYKSGPDKSDVDSLVEKYRKGSFDGMTDCYDYKKNHENMPRVNFIFISDRG